MRTTNSKKVFYLIVMAQFCGTSVWFAGNAVLPQLLAEYSFPAGAVGFLTSAVQLGFIIGTLVFAIAGISDKWSPSKVFFFSSAIASLINAVMLISPSSFELILVTRFGVGIALAGIYPVGMKIASDWNETGLGHWLGALVGALVLGTAFPHSLKLFPGLPEIHYSIIAVSVLCLTGGLIVYLFVKDGPFRKPATDFSFRGILKAFSSDNFRAPALGYFGHMWELYAMWAFIPMIFVHYSQINHLSIDPSALAFVVIGGGSLGCYMGGILSSRIESATLATVALLVSGLCCVLSPWIWNLPLPIFMTFMVVWGITMAADSPQFSALVARNAPAEVRGSAITMVVCIGFAITIISIQLLVFAENIISFKYIFLVLAPGPAFGCLAMRKMFTSNHLKT